MNADTVFNTVLIYSICILYKKRQQAQQKMTSQQMQKQSGTISDVTAKYHNSKHDSEAARQLAQ